MLLNVIVSTVQFAALHQAAVSNQESLQANLRKENPEVGMREID